MNSDKSMSLTFDHSPATESSTARVIAFPSFALSLCNILSTELQYALSTSASDSDDDGYTSQGHVNSLPGEKGCLTYLGLQHSVPSSRPCRPSTKSSTSNRPLTHLKSSLLSYILPNFNTNSHFPWISHDESCLPQSDPKACRTTTGLSARCNRKTKSEVESLAEGVQYGRY